jgi:hypothetical protein
LKIGIADFLVSRPTVNGLWHRIEKGKVVVESVWANARLRLKHEQKSKSVFGPAIFKKFGEMERWSMMPVDSPRLENERFWGGKVNG